VVSKPFDSTMATIRRNMQFQEGRYDRMHILEKGRNQNRYSEERRKNERQNEEDPHWREQQHCYDERRFGRRYGEDQWEINQQPRPARLDFPKFDGDNPTRWIYKVEQFFEHYQTLERRKLKWQHSVWREKH
jgi:hypothetical protein